MINYLSNTATFGKGIAAKRPGPDRQNGGYLYVCVHVEEACNQDVTLMQLYKGLIRVFSNHTASLKGGL
jgi:hypothetical protein